MTDQLPALNQEYLDPKFLLDDDHPANQDYIRNLEDIKRAIVAQSRPMLPRTIECVKSYKNGATKTEIAKRMDLNPNTVAKHLKRTDALKLGSLLAHFKLAIDGPMEMQRRAMLWEIALDCQVDEPKTSISAVVELNKMAGAYDKSNDSGPVQIVINNNVFPRGALD